MRVFFLSVVVLGLLAGSARAATLEEIPGNFDGPMFVASYPNNAEKLLIPERRGKIDLYQGGKTTTFADLTSRVACAESGCSGERGLMSIALAPDFATSGRLYADYADDSTGTIHIDELTASGDTATWTRSILEIPHPGANNHNGGQLQFGPDGMLYASTGDGGGGNDEFHNSQNPESLLGKILRINLSASPPTVQIWNMGLRNPFRFSFDRVTGDMVIGDVGQSAREEIDLAPSPSPGVVGGQGWNYGWNCREGLIAGPETDLPQEECGRLFSLGAFVDPVFDYPHSGAPPGAAQGCAIIGGYLSRDPSVPDLYGRYLYADLCEAEVRSIDLKAANPSATDRNEGLPKLGSVVSFGEDACRRIYVVTGNTEVVRFTGPTPATCPPPEPGPGPTGGQPPASGSVPIPPGGAGPATTRIRLRAHDQVVDAGDDATLTAIVTPCAGRGRERVELHSHGHTLATRRLGKGCAAVFHPAIQHRSRFRALIAADGRYAAARSNRVVVHVR